MAINALSYIGVNSDKLEDWYNFAVKHLGMQKIDNSSKSLSFKMDNQKQRFSISGESGDALAFLGWEVEKKSDLQIYANRLDKINIFKTLLIFFFFFVTYIHILGNVLMKKKARQSVQD